MIALHLYDDPDETRPYIAALLSRLSPWSRIVKQIRNVTRIP